MIDARLWLIQSDGSRYRCARPQPKDVIITHEFWMPTGDRLAYVYRKADDGSTETIRMMRPETLEEELFMPCLPYAHFICDRQRRWFVGDCQGQETPIHLQTGEGRGQEVRNDFIYLVDIARKKEIPLCYHGTSWTTIHGTPQDAHPHPCFTPDGSGVVFTSDREANPACIFQNRGRCGERRMTIMEWPKLKNIYICFPGGRHKVLTMSFDDGRVEDRRLVELFNRYGVRGTFNLNAGLLLDDRVPPSEWRDLYRGHEVACHTCLHPTIARSPLDQVARQILEDRQGLESVMGYPVRGLAYPNGSWTPEIAAMLPSLGIRYARVVGDTHDFAIPNDFMTWKSTCHHTHQLLEDGKRFAALFKTQYLYMMYVWGHSFEFTCEADWEQMERFCDLVAGREDTWYATNIEIVDYLEDARRLQFTVAADIVHNPAARSIWIEVDGDRIEIPGGATVQLS